jgi:hypothetical protein
MKKFSEWFEGINESYLESKQNRLLKDPELEHIEGPFAISKERGREIWKKGNERHNWDKICTKEEKEEIKRVYEMMPDRYSWMDALFLIMAKQDKR